MRDRRRRFALRLALELGYPNPDAMLREMPAQQFDEWIAFYQLEPWGILAQDVISAHFKALYVNNNRKHGKSPYKIDKFLCYGEKKKNADDIFAATDEE